MSYRICRVQSVSLEDSFIKRRSFLSRLPSRVHAKLCENAVLSISKPLITTVLSFLTEVSSDGWEVEATTSPGGPSFAPPAPTGTYGAP